MSMIFIYTLFNKNNSPAYIGIKNGDNVITRELFQPTGNKPLIEIYNSIDKINQLFLNCNRQIILSDFKRHIPAFSLPVTSDQYDIYDLHLPNIKPPADVDSQRQIVLKVLDRVSKCKPYPYQKLIANASVVYHDLENKGVIVNYTHMYPKWNLETFSGRSKNTGVNIQGWSEDDIIRPVVSSDNNVLIHFDFVCADLRVASILADDKRLMGTFENGDPYQELIEVINSDSEGNLTREEGKLFLLKSINSMDAGDVLYSIYPKLAKWIDKCRLKIDNGDNLETLLGRKFNKSRAKNNLAVLNGVMQGSVAHAMQSVIRRIWEKFPANVVCEIHDSLVLSCHNDPVIIKSFINIAAPIIGYPFNGLLDANPFFPFKVSIGKRWKKWKFLKTYRESDVKK